MMGWFSYHGVMSAMRAGSPRAHMLIVLSKGIVPIGILFFSVCLIYGLLSERPSTVVNAEGLFWDIFHTDMIEDCLTIS